MNFEMLKNFMDDMARNHSPGNAAEVYLNGKLVFQYACGYENLETKNPLTGKEMFNIYSCSKVITCTAALQLMEKGLFSLRFLWYNIMECLKGGLWRDRKEKSGFFA